MTISNLVSSVMRHRNQLFIHQIRGYKKSRVFGYRPDLDNVLVRENDKTNLASAANHNVIKLVDEYKKYGHYLAMKSVNPLSSQETDGCYERIIKTIERDIEVLKDELLNCNTPLSTKCLINTSKEVTTPQDLFQYLDEKYGQASPISIEFMHIPDRFEREWIAKEFELLDRSNMKNAEKKFAQMIIESEVIELFMAKKFPSVKRYSGEGSESMNIFFHQLFGALDPFTCPEVFVGMAHRGRLAFLIQLLKFPPAIMFRKMSGKSEIDRSKYPNSTGDVLSHLFISSDVNDGLNVTLLPNPSHLEAVSPVVGGAARASCLKHQVSSYSDNDNPLMSPLAVQVHGDGSFTGQGIVMETVAMSKLPHFSVDGSLHLIINNQLGYTTPSDRGRSSIYASDLVKMIDSPVIHVNGFDPVSVALSAKFALKYRNVFKKDVLIDMMCYRKHGHNELDDPSFTNPNMYQEILSPKSSFPDRYGRKILEEDEYQSVRKNYESYLNEEFKFSQNDSIVIQDFNFQSKELLRASKESITTWDTGYDVQKLKEIGLQTIAIPSEFSLHPTLKKSLIDSRTKILETGERIDWSTAEALAFGSLLEEGFNVRLVGQDVGRGTFSQRHAMVVDQSNGHVHIPINDLKTANGKLEIVNSLLSEEAVLACEYGFSLISPETNLSIWEAQFGDFFNGAQIVIDTMISSGELKWTLQTNLILLLPHGYDGAGPEHSSCRMERFLQMSDSSFDAVDSDDVNMAIVNPTTPAQYFHLIRRQMKRTFKKPLIVVSPKILLRHPQAVSNLSDLSQMKYFEPVIDDSKVDPSKVDRLIFCSGKHYYALDKERDDKSYKNVTIIRLEELCPFPAAHIIQILNKYPNVRKLIWSQEEHMNMGAWSHVSARFDRLLNRSDLTYCGRNVLGSPATGIGALHKNETIEIIEKPFK